MPEESGQSLDYNLKKFYNLVSLGIQQGTPDIYSKQIEFERQITFKGSRYEVALPWNLSTHAVLLFHYELSLKRLTGLLRRLRQSPDVFQQYDKVIREQLDKEIVEIVNDTEVTTNLVYYLPHHPVVRENKLTTTTIRIIYNASAKSSGPFLNNCQYAESKFFQSIMDIHIVEISYT